MSFVREIQELQGDALRALERTLELLSSAVIRGVVLGAKNSFAPNRETFARLYRQTFETLNAYVGRAWLKNFLLFWMIFAAPSFAFFAIFCLAASAVVCFFAAIPLAAFLAASALAAFVAHVATYGLGAAFRLLVSKTGLPRTRGDEGYAALVRGTSAA